jgi:hypothetical protein
MLIPRNVSTARCPAPRRNMPIKAWIHTTETLNPGNLKQKKQIFLIMKRNILSNSTNINKRNNYLSPQTSHLKQLPLTSNIKQLPLTWNISFQTITSHLKHQTITSHLKHQTITSHLKHLISNNYLSPQTSNNYLSPETSHFKQLPLTSNIKQLPLTSNIKQLPLTSNLKQLPLTSNNWTQKRPCSWKSRSWFGTGTNTFLFVRTYDSS